MLGSVVFQINYLGLCDLPPKTVQLRIRGYPIRLVEGQIARHRTKEYKQKFDFPQ